MSFAEAIDASGCKRCWGIRLFAQNKKTIIDNVADSQIRVASISPPPLLSPTIFATDML